MDRELDYICIEHNTKKYNIYTFHLESLNNPKIRQDQIGIINYITSNFKNASHNIPTICCGDSNLKPGEMGLGDYINGFEEIMHGPTSHGDRYFNLNYHLKYDRFWYRNCKLIYFEQITGEFNNIWVSDHDGLFAIIN